MENVEESPNQTHPPPLEPEDWQPVCPHYATVLRLRLLPFAAVVLIAPHLIPDLELGQGLWWFSGIAALAFALLIFVWVPRRVRFTRYLRRELDMNMQTGYWWRNTTSVAINRIQHLEITQGPLERMLGLNKLVIYTAGGGQSDLKLPGLEADIASQLKAQLLNQIAQEDTPREAAIDGLDS